MSLLRLAIQAQNKELTPGVCVCVCVCVCDKGTCTGRLPLIQLGKFGDCDYVAQLCQRLTLSELRGAAGISVRRVCVCVWERNDLW